MNSDPNIQDMVTREKLVKALKLIIDPELGIDIVEMGLIYWLEVDEVQKKIQVEMTLSSKGCPMSQAIIGGVENILKSRHPGYLIITDIKWEPEWEPGYISEAGVKLLES